MKYQKNDAKDANKHRNSRSVTHMVTEEEDMKCKAYIWHGEDGISLEFMLKRDIYEKLINREGNSEKRKQP